ncbi:hypothetical protein B0I37DRAFT_420544 [Chaetomium sp. MPI-CAGE-AT-0009]|nr:hypothetical protein B0I37DRAFT_420544 [Chaetomium sp. MPI-CAGE-AT-0009]
MPLPNPNPIIIIPTPQHHHPPPLPPAFHDLYATTVRTTTHDDPTLHQGRTRQNPHTPGSWPSHVYIEWHPPPTTHALLTNLLTTLQTTLQTTTTTNPGTGTPKTEVTSFLTSDLATPQPLHISLSRPVVVGTGQKGGFLREVGEAVVVRGGKTEEVFGLGFAGEGGEKGDDENPNPELTALLRRCNAVVARYGQPGLYEWAEDGGGDRGKRIGEAFHVSIAWSFAEPTEELVRATERVFGGRDTQQKLREVQIPVEGIKVKIGNVVTNVALRQPGMVYTAILVAKPHYG